MLGVDQHGLRVLREFLDPPLGNPVLMMDVHPARRNCLAPLGHIVRPLALRKSPVVCMVVSDVNPMLGSISFEGVLPLQSLFPTGGLLTVYVSKSCIVVHEDGGTSVPCFGGCPLQLGDEPWSCALQLVNRD